MRIRKEFQVTPTNALLENGDSTSATNGYTAEYINNHSVVVSPTEPSGSARKKVWKQHSKNLFNKNNANVLNAYLNISYVIASNNDERTIYIECKPNTTYTISKAIGTPANSNRFRVGTTSVLPANNVSLLNYVYYNIGTDVTSITITTPATAKYLCVYCWATDNTSTLEEMLDSIQIEQGSTATTYEPYADDKTFILNDNDIYEEYQEELDTLLKSEVLWTNSSPSSPFGQQNIILAKNCKKIDIIFNRITTDSNQIVCSVYNKNTFTECIGTLSGGKIIKRMTALNNNKLIFGDGIVFNTYATASGDNNYMIPLQIIGYIKITD